MLADAIILRTTISASLLRQTLLRGSLLGAIGAAILLSGGLLTATYLQYWGWTILFLGIGLITVGLLPYRQMKRLENKPNELIIDLTHLQYKVGGYVVCAIPLSAVERIIYLEHGAQHGIGVVLKRPLSKNISRFCLPKERRRLSRPYFAKERCDFFFRYFSKRSYARIEGVLEPSLEDVVQLDQPKDLPIV